MTHEDVEGQTVLPIELIRHPVSSPPRPFRSVVVRFSSNDGADVLSGRIEAALRLACKVEVLLVDKSQVSLLGCHRTNSERVRASVLRTESEMQQFVESNGAIDLVLAENVHVESIDLWNKQRRENCMLASSFLLQASSGRSFRNTSLRPYRSVSVGGTFNTFHKGHQEYLRLALSLADRVHLFVSTDAYAGPRKEYLPRRFSDRAKPIRKFLRLIGEGARVEIEALTDIADIQRYVEKDPDLDLVLVERVYLEWFEQWNERRGAIGLRRYDILCKARTLVMGVEIASTLLVGRRKRRSWPGSQLSLRLFSGRTFGRD